MCCVAGIVTDHTALEVVKLVSESSDYVLCPGLKPSFYEDKTDVVGYDRGGVQVINAPIKRYESNKCLLWHVPTNKRTPKGLYS